MQAPAIDPQIIAALGALQGTLGGQPALQAQQGQEQQGVVQQAQQAANAAGQAYQGAAAAPPPEVSSMAGFVPQLFGDVSSIMSGNPDYSKRGHEKVVQRQKDLAEARLQNLQALRDQFDVKQRAAEQLGNTELAGEAAMKKEQYAKTMDAILAQQRADLEATNAKNLESQRQKGRMELQSAKNKADLAKAAKDQADYFDTLINETDSGNQWLDSTNVPQKQKSQLMQYAKDNGMIVADKNNADRLKAAKEVFLGFKDLEDVMGKYLYPGTDLQGTASTAAHNMWMAGTQQNEDLASFGNSAMLALRDLQALASGMGSGLRITREEYRRMVNNFPKITDNLPTAQRKLAWEKKFLQNKERSIFGKNWKPPDAGAATTTASTAPAGARTASGIPVEIKAQAMKMARTEDYSGLAKLIEKYPALDQDADLDSLTSAVE